MTDNKKRPEKEDLYTELSDAVDEVERRVAKEMRKMFKLFGLNPDTNIVEGNDTIN